MVNYSCEDCEKTFTHKGTWQRHINKKKSCKNTQPVPDEDIQCAVVARGDDQCQYCNKNFTTTRSLIRHQNKFCKLKIYITENSDSNTKLNKVCDELERLKQELEILKNNPPNICPKTINSNNTTNIINNTNIVNNTINNVVIHMFGKEDLSHLTVKEYKRVFKRCNFSVPEFILLKHFDENKPENNNIYISNLKSEYVTMYDGDKWIVADKDTMIQNLYDDNCGMLIEKFEDLKEQLDANTQNKFNMFIDRHDDEETINNSKKEIKQVLYNNRHIPIKNKKNKK